MKIEHIALYVNDFGGKSNDDHEVNNQIEITV